MSKEIILIENDALTFGTPNETEKQKLKGFEAFGDVYNVKSYNEATRLEKNDSVVIETVPGSKISGFKYDLAKISFEIEGNSNTQVTLMLEEKREYKVIVDKVTIGIINSGTSGKVTFSVDTKNKAEVSVKAI